MSDFIKQPPQAPEVEKQLLSLLITDTAAFKEVQAILRPEIFYGEKNTEIATAITLLAKAGRSINALNLCEQLSELGKYKQAGGDAYLMELQNLVSFSYSAQELTMILFQKYIRRKVIEGCQNSLKNAYNESVDEFDLLEDVRKNVLEIHSSLNKSTRRTLSDMVDSYYKEILDAINSGEHVRGIKTYIPALDNRLGGLVKGRMITIAGRPGSGKTALLIQMVVNICLLNDKKTFVVYSLEMTGEELINRVVSCLMRYPYERISRGDLDEQYHNHFSAHLKELKRSKNLIIVDNLNDIDEIAMDAKAKSDSAPIDGVILDYLQLSRAKAVKQGNREQVVSHISQTIKNTAKELGVPFIALAQLNRDTEKMADKKPQLNHLRESGSLEQDSDSVTFLYRPFYAGFSKNEDGDKISENECWLLTRKNRHGAAGEDEVWCDIACNIFRDTNSTTPF